MLKFERIVPSVIGVILVALIVVFVARLLGAAVVHIETPAAQSCEVSVDYVCPVQ
jgi:hypothetical protein